MVHYLNTIEREYREILDGKRFYIHSTFNDFKKGDTVHFVEWSPESGDMGGVLRVVVTFVTRFMQNKDWIVFGFDRLS